MLLKNYLAKLNAGWARDNGLKVDVINRLSRLGYSLVDEVKPDDKPVIASILKRASDKWGSTAQVADPLHVAYPIAVPIATNPGASSKCPHCGGLMRSAKLSDDLDTLYCVQCRVCKVQ